MIDVQIIGTGSKGNAVVINDEILIDCGIPFKALKDYYRGLKLVLLTHIHSDHFNDTTIRLLSLQRPALRFACCDWLSEPLKRCSVKNVDILKTDTFYNYGICKISAVPLVHNVPNCGWKIHFSNGEKLIYCTDTNNLNGIAAPDYDLYLIEANYGDEEIKERIKEKSLNGEYAYEMQVLKNHLSKAKCDDFIYKNIGSGGRFIYMHQHAGKDDYNSEAF